MPDIMLGGAGAAQFPLQFPEPGFNIISMSCTLIQPLSRDGLNEPRGHASGCFWRHGNKVYLLTARHVMSGRHAFTDQFLPPYGFEPRSFFVYPAVRTDDGGLRRVRLTVALNGDEGGWLQDPEFETLRTDIAMVDINYYMPGAVYCLNDEPAYLDPIYTTVGMDVAIVGYPTSNFHELMTPIWRRGSIASEPNFPIDKRPIFLVDAATGRGFSGSPVFRRHFGPLPVPDGKGGYDINTSKIVTNSFVGIYAGRQNHCELHLQVPYVFYANRIPRILEVAPPEPAGIVTVTVK